MRHLVKSQYQTGTELEALLSWRKLSGSYGSVPVACLTMASPCCITPGQDNLVISFFFYITSRLCPLSRVTAFSELIKLVEDMNTELQCLECAVDITPVIPLRLSRGVPNTILYFKFHVIGAKLIATNRVHIQTLWLLLTNSWWINSLYLTQIYKLVPLSQYSLRFS